MANMKQLRHNEKALKNDAIVAAAAKAAADKSKKYTTVRKTSTLFGDEKKA